MTRLKALLPERIRAAKAGVEAGGLGAALITNPVSIKYLTDFNSSNAYVVLTPGESFLATDFRYIEAAEKNGAGLTPVLIDRSFTVFDLMNREGIKKAAIEEDYITYSFFREVSDKFNGEVVPAGSLIRDLRVIKDDYEKDCIRRAEEIGDEAFSHILGFIRPGVKETDIALELEFFMRKQGAEGLSFETIAVSGLKSSMPHGEPSDKKVEEGEVLTMDYGCRYRGYCSDMTRTVAVGGISPEAEKIYNIVLEAQKTTVEAVSAGKPAVEIDRTARDIIKCHGYGECFGHGLGHGVGLEIHEAPTANPSSDEILQKGMTVTVEPGIYLPGKFGVRIEDLLLVEENGAEVLSHSDKNLIII